VDTAADRRFFVQGGDWGAIVAQAMVHVDPLPIKGVHLNFFPSPPTFSSLLPDLLRTRLWGSAESQARHRAAADVGAMLRHTGYMHQQASAGSLGKGLTVRLLPPPTRTAECALSLHVNTGQQAARALTTL
jgi:hypothetical protein